MGGTVWPPFVRPMFHLSSSFIRAFNRKLLNSLPKEPGHYWAYPQHLPHPSTPSPSPSPTHVFLYTTILLSPRNTTGKAYLESLRPYYAACVNRMKPALQKTFGSIMKGRQLCIYAGFFFLFFFRKARRKYRSGHHTGLDWQIHDLCCLLSDLYPYRWAVPHSDKVIVAKHLHLRNKF